MATIDEYLRFYRLDEDSVNMEVLELSLSAVVGLIDMEYRKRGMNVAQFRIDKGILPESVYNIAVFQTVKKYYQMLQAETQEVENLSSFSESIGDFSQSMTFTSPVGFKLSDSLMKMLGLNVLTVQNLKL